jgi:hypothetical protein
MIITLCYCLFAIAWITGIVATLAAVIRDGFEHEGIILAAFLMWPLAGVIVLADALEKYTRETAQREGNQTS